MSRCPGNSLSKKRKLLQLLALVSFTAAIWLVLLPLLTRLPSSQRYLQRLDARGIDPSAMYYTELPAELFLDAR